MAYLDLAITIMIVVATIVAVINRGALGPDPHETERVFVRVHSPSPPLHPLDHPGDGGMTELGDSLVDDPPPAYETPPVYEAPPV
ncbi:hypothetical protein BDV97DRAFT_396014 [Delphinella strobiligena]|nr:hypothetical protein BDV97DRAFT_396014 [Delphinella strobiligena]